MYPTVLTAQAGDRICILGKVDEQWLFGQCGGNQGSFPASFVDTVPLDLPFYDPATASQGSSEVAQLSQQRKTSEDTSDEVCVCPPSVWWMIIKWISGAVRKHASFQTERYLQIKFKKRRHYSRMKWFAVLLYSTPCWPNEVRVGWLSRCPGKAWGPIRKRAHMQLVLEHSATVISAFLAIVDWSWPKEWNKCARVNLHFKEKKECRRGMNDQAFSKYPRNLGKSHHHCLLHWRDCTVLQNIWILTIFKAFMNI